MDKWEAKIVFRPDMLAHAVYLVRDRMNAHEYLTSGSPLTITTVQKGEIPKDDVVFAYLDPDMIEALGAAINKEGYKVPNEHLIEGKLTATERHLEDMRALVFKKK